MKLKIFWVLLCGLFIANSISAQKYYDRSNGQTTPNDPHLSTSKSFKAPVLSDTTAALTAAGIDSLGIMFVQRIPPCIWVRDTVSTGGHKWDKFQVGDTASVAAVLDSLNNLKTQIATINTTLTTKQDAIALGTTAQYFRGDLSLATFPSVLSFFTNDVGYLDSAIGQYSITGKGTPATPLQLLNDNASPGANEGYITNTGGTKGWGPITRLDSIRRIPGKDSVYAYINGVKTFAFRDSLGAGVDTTSLSARINLKVNISDTSTMLSPYLRRADTTSMLSPYLRKTDTSTISARINLKVNISDTSTMLSHYMRYVDSASLSNRINVKYGPTDTLSTLATQIMLGLKEPTITAANSIKKYWNGYKQFVSFNTDSITEGTTNQYYTQARARAAVSNAAPITYSSGVFGADTTTALTGLATQADLLKYINKVSDTSAWHTLNYYNTIYVPSTGTANRVLVYNGSGIAGVDANLTWTGSSKTLSLPNGEIDLTDGVNSTSITPLAYSISSTGGGNLVTYMEPGQIGFGTPTSTLHAIIDIGPGGTAANTGQIHFIDGSLLTTPQKGAAEFHNGLLYFTDSISGTVARDTVALRGWVRANITGGGFTNPMTAAGQMIYGGISGAATQTATPGHAGMRPIWDGSVVKWTDTTASGAGGITALTGDVTASGSGSVAATLATVNTNTGSWGSATQVPTFTVNGKGLITAASNTTIQIAESQVTNLTTDLAAKASLTSPQFVDKIGIAAAAGTSLITFANSPSGTAGLDWGNVTLENTSSGILTMGGNFGMNGGSSIYIGTGTIRNSTSANNASMTFPIATGPVISRNVADAATAFTVNQVNASSTGLIFDAQFGGASKFSVTTAGAATAVSLTLSGTSSVPAQSAKDSSLKIANTKYVDAAVHVVSQFTDSVRAGSFKDTLLVGGSLIHSTGAGGKDSISLSGDNLTPGNNKVYGTNSSGTNGWLDNTKDSLDYVHKVYAILGSTIKAQPPNGNLVSITTNVAPTSQTVYFTTVYLPYQATITGAIFEQHTQGVYTANNYNGFQLYSLNAATGLLTTIDSTVNDGTIWKQTAGTWNKKAFSSTHLLAAGVYVLAFMYSQSAVTTAPQLGCLPTMPDGVASGMDFSNSIKISSFLATQTAMPTPTKAFSLLTGFGTNWGVGLY